MNVYVSLSRSFAENSENLIYFAVKTQIKKQIFEKTSKLGWCFLISF